MRVFQRTGQALLAAVIATGALTASVVSISADELKIAHFMPAMHPMDRGVMTPLSEQLAAATNGELTIRIFPSGELGKGPVQQYKRVVTGVADIVFGIPGYTPKQFPKTALLHVPGLFADGAAATNAVWDNIDLLKDEFSKTKLLGLWANNPSVLLTRNKPVRTLADLKGMKIRTPNQVMAKLVEAWGAIPVSMPVTETYNAMNTGVIDSVMIGPSGIRSYKLNEIAKYVTTNIPTALDSFYLLMNQQSWDGLSDSHKEKLTALTGREMSLKGAKAFYEAGQAGLKLAKDSNVEMIEIDAAADAEFRVAMKPVLAAFVKATSEKSGVDASGIVSAFSGK
ncbi:MAG: TRAP transporter substrate-binding protein [Cohaesibacteraceae bacterium]|nr:TRAP transporter substrate-binding protein [Cohaesibacteraceae bacterium]